MVAVPNAQYNVTSPGSFAVKVAVRMRRRMFRLFLERTGVARDQTVLDVGATSDRSYESSNYLEAWYPHKDRITAVGIDDASFLEELYPGVTFRSADGRALPFADGEFDVVHSSAVLEHVGGAENQRQFIRELARVARRAVFVTTPNRWYPVEFHTMLPLVHWLPKQSFRTLLRLLGYESLAREENLNLLDTRELNGLAEGLPGCIAEVSSVSLLGWPSNLILTIRKLDDGAATVRCLR